MTASLLIVILLAPQWGAQAADMYPPTVSDAPQGLQDAVLALVADPNALPAYNCAHYVITSYTLREVGIYNVSLTGLTSQADPNTWSVFDGVSLCETRIVEVTVYSDGTWHASSLPNNYLIDPGGGNGDSSPRVYFPWAAGYAAYYGTLGVHGEGDFGLTGWYAVDWVGGDEYGEQNSYDGLIFASQTAVIDYVCRDGTSLAIRAGDFLYAHLNPALPLDIGDTIYRGQPIGTVVRGSFSDNCGHAVQADNHYHVHWMFHPDGNRMIVEDWVLDIQTQNWTSMVTGETVGPGSWIVSSWGTTGYGSGEGGGETTTYEPAPVGSGQSLWDPIVNASLNALAGVMSLFPAGRSWGVFSSMTRNAAVAIRIGWILMRSHFSLIVPFLVVSTIMLTETIILAFRLVRIIIRIIALVKSLIPVVG
ncbi:MAG: hypothetical protein D6706_13550 [Chloroflexi bacterium]|nr:MAG: hypothetical protein D6706_13550 [Chloroflexota bacterium]